MSGIWTDSPTAFSAAKWIVQSNGASAATTLSSFFSSRMSQLWSFTVLPVIFWTRFSDSLQELQKLSTTTTSWPAFRSSTHVCEPMNPAPPVTKTFIALLLVPT